MARLPDVGEDAWGETLNQYLLVAHLPDGQLRTEAVVQASRQYSVRAYGAAGDGQADDGPAIQAALDDIATAAPGATLHFPAGTYLVGTELEIKSAVHLEMDQWTVVRRGNAASKYIFKNTHPEHAPTGYQGRGDIRITGGILDVDGVTIPSGATAIALAHAEHVHIERVTIRNVRAGHAIELTAVSRGVVRDCMFDGFVPGDAGGYAVEAVHLDVATDLSARLELSPITNDSTPCKDILVVGCTARAYGQLLPFGRLVGSRTTVNDKWHKNIRVTGNYAESMPDYPVRALNWNDSVVEGNTFVDCNGGVAYLTASHATKSSENIVIANNIFRNSGVNTAGSPVVTGVISVIGLDKPASVFMREVAITGNVISGYANVSGIECIMAADVLCSGNIITSAGRSNGIACKGCPAAIITGNKFDTGASNASLAIVGQAGIGSENTIISGNSFSNVGPVIIESASCVVTGNSFINPLSIGLLLNTNAAYAAVTGNAFSKTAGPSFNAIETRVASALIQTNSFRGWGGKEGIGGALRRNTVLAPNMATSTINTDNLNRYNT